MQVALTALGHPTGATDGVFNPRTRQQIAAWQKARGEPATGFLSGPQNQALLSEAAPAVTRFDDEQKKADEARRKLEEEKARAAAAPPAVVPPAPRPAPPQPAAAAPAGGLDGRWQGIYHCTPSQGGPEMNLHVTVEIANGTGTWQPRPGGMSVTLRVNGDRVFFTRNYHPFNNVEKWNTASIAGRWSGRSITASGPEANSGGRSCEINLTKL